MRTAALLLLLLLAACGADSDGSGATPTRTVPAAGQEAAIPMTPAPTGEPVPAALSRFRCEPDGSGTFTASGVLSNATKKTVTFQVTVFVGAPAPNPQQARTQQVPKVAAGGSIEFQVAKIPAAPEGGTCHVQVLTTK
ncbi:hypothetical protein [Aeromicrobium wangtongii]|uniref:hypothetical protein n=1 Tax=Aeromicrobium wangtongii TaxID=2969247 RepID=UPI0020170E11|nr:hypothetical protein [Aeromicrobium wangtongii]MCL3816867.1 hypothetical protein [Aeromicrobium wangtongii]